MQKAFLLGMLSGFIVFLISDMVGLKTYIGGVLFATAWVSAVIATYEAKKHH